MKIAVIPNKEKSGVKKITNAVIERLKSKGAEVYAFLDGFSDDLLSQNNLYKICDVIITVGGDGTIIKYAKEAALFNKSVLGINAGRLGFLADVEKDNLELLDRLVCGDYEISERFMLCAKVYSKDKLVAEGVALNDAVLTTGGITRLIDIDLEISSDIINYRADGIIVATPTGSTAYSMSAGGPIIEPSVRCFAVTPICSHSLTARPLIVGENSKLIIKLPRESEEMAIFSLDGKFISNVDCDTRIEIEKAQYDVRLINLSKNAIYKTLSLKF